MRHAAVRVSFRSFMVQRDQWDTYWGPKKLFFLIRDIDDATMTAASMESCRFVTRRSPGGRFRSVVDVGKRLHRTRGGFHRCIHMSKVLCALCIRKNAVDHPYPVCKNHQCSRPLRARMSVASPYNAEFGVLIRHL